MPIPDTLQYLAEEAQDAAEEAELDRLRKEARCAWARRIVAAYAAAQARADAAWLRLIADHPEEDDEALFDLCPPEQHEADALHAQIAAVRDHDRWPRKLHWSV